MRFLQNDERFGVDLADNGLQLRGLPPPDGAEQNLLLLAGITAAALQNRDAAVELFLNGKDDFFKAFGDDERDRGIVQPIDDPVHHDGRHIERHGGIEGLADIVIDCAGQGDLIVCLYNPKSKKRTGYVEQAAEILMRYRQPETPVGIVRHAGRKEESKQITTLAELKNAEIDMFSVVIIGNSQTYVSSGRMITPRGYALK